MMDNLNGCTDYGDYDGEVDICACGHTMRLGEVQCKTCASRAIHDGQDARYQRRKLANHRIRVFWLAVPEPDPIAAYVAELGRQVRESVRAAQP